MQQMNKKTKEKQILRLMNNHKNKNKFKLLVMKMTIKYNK